jgi:hypothetical protein
LPTATTADLGGDADDDQRIWFDAIPNEIWILIMGYLEPRTLTTAIMLVNKRFKALVSYEPLWQRIYHFYFLPWRQNIEILYYASMNSLSRSSQQRKLTWHNIVAMRYQVEQKYFGRALLNHNIMDEYTRLARETNNTRPLNHSIVELLSDHGDILLNAARTAQEAQQDEHLWLRLFCIELYEACLTLIPSEWKTNADTIPYISPTATDLPQDLNQYTQQYPPFWRSIHNLAIVIMDLHGFVICNNDEQQSTCQKLLILIDHLIHRYESSTIYEQCFPSPIANWARLFLDCGSDMMEEDPHLSQVLLEKSICLFAKELNITNARQLIVDYDSCYCYADALVRLAAVIPVDNTNKYFDNMNELLDKSYQAFGKCCELKPTDFITIYRTGLVVIRRINLVVMMTSSDLYQQLELSKMRKELVTKACQYFEQCIQVQNYYRAHEMWGMVLFDEAERLFKEWLQLYDTHGHDASSTLATSLYDTLQHAIDQYAHAQHGVTQSLGHHHHMAFYCQQDIACATSRQFEIRLRQWQHAKQEEQSLIDSIQHAYKISISHEKRKLKVKQVLVKQLKRDMNRLHYKAMMEFEALLEQDQGFSYYHIARLKCLMGDENHTKQHLYKILGSGEYDYDIGSKGDVIYYDSAFQLIRDRVWFKRFLKQLCKINQQLVNKTIQT